MTEIKIAVTLREMTRKIEEGDFWGMTVFYTLICME